MHCKGMEVLLAPILIPQNAKLNMQFSVISLCLIVIDQQVVFFCKTNADYQNIPSLNRPDIKTTADTQIGCSLIKV